MLSLTTLLLSHFCIVNSLIFHQNQSYQLYTNVEEVDFDGIQGAIYTASLRDLISVKQLTIRNGEIDRIDNGALCTIRLKQLNLFDNWRLPKLTQNLFDNCTYLEQLKIVNNYDLIIDNHAFSLLINLKDLLISNQIVRRLTNDFLKNLTMLETLRIRFCRIDRIDPDAFTDLTNLKTLELVFNNFKIIDGLASLTNLQMLDLSNNKLETFNWSALHNLNDLKSVVLSWNNFKDFDTASMVDHLNQIDVLELEMNPIECRQRKTIYNKLMQHLNKLDLYIGVFNNGTCVE